jgi:hypothetical protein
VGLLVLAALGTVFVVHSRPLTVDQRDLVTAARDHRVIAVEVEDNRTLIWVRDDARRFRSDVRHVTRTNVTGIDLPAEPAAAVTEVERMQQRPVRHRSTLLPQVVNAVVGSLFFLAVFVLLVAGPPPRVGNRWFWAWILMIPGVGLLAFLALSGPLPNGYRLFPTLDPMRRNGGTGFAYFCVALVLQFVLLIVRVTAPDLVSTVLA